MTNTQKLIFARALNHLYFFAAVSIPYFVWRGLTLPQAYSMQAINSILVVILEYPTGVIGDKLGHKTSVTTGLAFWFVGLLLLALPMPYWGYALTISLISIGSALESGSDIALLKSNSENFKKDFANYKTLTIGLLGISAVIAGYLAKIWMPLPLIATAFISSIGAIIIYVVPLKEVKSQAGNIFEVAKNAINHLRNKQILAFLLIFSGFIAGYQGALKYVLNSFTEVFSYDIAIVTSVIAAYQFLRSFGYKFSEKIGNINESILVLILIVFLIIGAIFQTVPYLPLIITALLGFVTAMINYQTIIEINEATPDGIRASILSLNSLIGRFFNSTYLFIVGYLLDLFDFRIMIAGTLGFISFAFGLYSYGKYKVGRLNK